MFLLLLSTRPAFISPLEEVRYLSDFVRPYTKDEDEGWPERAGSNT